MKTHLFPGVKMFRFHFVVRGVSSMGFLREGVQGEGVTGEP